MADSIDEWVDTHLNDYKRVCDGFDRYKDLDLVVLDNSVRESTIGQLKGHTTEDKFKIFEEAAKCGFQVWNKFGVRLEWSVYSFAFHSAY